MNWLASIIRGLFGSIWEHWQTQSEKPRPITHAETPPAKLEQFQESIEDYKRRKDDEAKRNPPVP